MEHGTWLRLLRQMMAAGGVRCLPARTPWPMHAALAELYDEAGRAGLRRALAMNVAFDPSPETGRAASGADAAFRDLVRTGFLQQAGPGLGARLHVNQTALVGARR